MVIAEADLVSMFKKDIEIYEQLRVNASLAAPGNNFSDNSMVELHTDMEALLKGTRKAQVEATIIAARANMVNTLGLAKTAVQNHVLEYGLVIGSPGADPSRNEFLTCWADLFRYYAENGKRVTSRNFTFGSPSLTGTGTGALVRLNHDAWGYVMEAQTADSKIARCIRDQVTGTGLGEEEFELKSSTASGRDALEEAGSGKAVSPIAALSARTSLSFGLQNPSFSTNTPSGATASPTDIGNWTSEVTLGGSALTVNGTNYEVLGGTGVSGYYRGYEGDTTPLALRCNANDWCLSQNLDSNGAAFELNKAYYVSVAVRRKSSSDGTLTLTLGRSSVSVAVNTYSNDAWNILKLSVTSDDCWAKNFGQENLKLSIALAGATTGSVDIDDVVIGEFTPFDGGLYAFVGGATAFRVEDKFTWSDAEINPSSTTLSIVMQKWFWRTWGLYLPSTPLPPGAPSLALAGAGAGNVDNGAHTYWVTWTDVNGIESGLGTSAAQTVTDKTTNGQVTVTRPSLPTVSSHITYWNVYRSTAGTTTPAKAHPVHVNVAKATASVTDNTADASLGSNHSGVAIYLSDPP